MHTNGVSGGDLVLVIFVGDDFTSYGFRVFLLLNNIQSKVKLPIYHIFIMQTFLEVNKLQVISCLLHKI